jgi:hypothetical protein
VYELGVGVFEPVGADHLRFKNKRRLPQLAAANALGMKVAYAEDNENADAWICHDEKGSWLTSHAHVTGPGGYGGFQGFEESLS